MLTKVLGTGTSLKNGQKIAPDSENRVGFMMIIRLIYMLESGTWFQLSESSNKIGQITFQE